MRYKSSNSSKHTNKRIIPVSEYDKSVMQEIKHGLDGIQESQKYTGELLKTAKRKLASAGKLQDYAKLAIDADEKKLKQYESKLKKIAGKYNLR